MGGISPKRKVAYVDALATADARHIYFHAINRSFEKSREITIDVSGFSGVEASAIRTKGNDYNRDGYADLILTFRTKDTNISCGDTIGVLTGETYSNPALTIKGSDTYTVVCP